MKQVVVAVGMDNALSSEDMNDLARLQANGYPMHIVYYMPEVPAQFEVLPSMNQTVIQWRKQAMEALKQVCQKLQLTKENCEFIDVNLGPDAVFDLAQKKAEVLLTPNQALLKQGILSRLWTRIFHYFQREGSSRIEPQDIHVYTEHKVGRGKVIPMDKMRTGSLSNSQKQNRGSNFNEGQQKREVSSEQETRHYKRKN